MTADRSPRRPLRLALQILLPLAVLALAWVFARGLMDSAPQAGRRPPPERQARLVEVIEAQRVSRPVRVEAYGEVHPAREVVLRAQVAGRVLSVHPDLVPGGRLAAGSTVARIEPRDYELALAQARGELTRAQAELALEQGQQAVAQREFELLGQQASPAERRLMLRAPQLETAQAAVAAARAKLAAAELALERTAVRAPFAAVVLERGVVEGSMVGASSDLARLAGTERWWVELAVPVAELRWIEVAGADSAGSRVRIHDAAAWGAERYREGRVVRLLGALEEQGRMARLLVEVEDPLGVRDPSLPRLLLGAFVRAEIEGRVLDNAFPLDPAWLHDGDQVWIMTAADRLEIRPVQVAHRGGTVLVTGGLEHGERIITTPINAAAAGMPLRVSAPREEPPNGE